MAYYIDDIEIIQELKCNLNYIIDYLSKNGANHIKIEYRVDPYGRDDENVILFQLPVSKTDFVSKNPGYTNTIGIKNKQIYINPYSTGNYESGWGENRTTQLRDHILNLKSYLRDKRISEIV